MSAADHISWAALLGKWTEFAKASVALPDTGDGGRWKRAVPHIISLQSITMALGELDAVDDGQRPLALDRAEITCRESAGAINDIWRGVEIPEGIMELVDDARTAFEDAANAGVEWTVAVASHTFGQPGALVAKLRQMGFAGDLFVPSPGAQLFGGSPAAFARNPGGASPHEVVTREIARFLAGDAKQSALSGPTRVTPPRQVYRQIDFARGGPVRDVVAPMEGDPPAGRPMLVPAVLAGQPQPLPPESKERIDPIPVEFE